MKKGWTGKEGASYGVAAQLPEGMSWERREPVRSGAVQADVVVPFSLALIFALGVGVFVALAGGELRLVALSGCGVFLVALLLLVYSALAGQNVVETVTPLDWRGSSQSVEPASKVTVELLDREQRKVDYFDLPVTEAELREVARAVLVLGHGFSRDELATKAGVLSQSKYRALSAAMVARGLLVEMAGNKRELSAAGRALLRSLVVGR